MRVVDCNFCCWVDFNFCQILFNFGAVLGNVVSNDIEGVVVGGGVSDVGCVVVVSGFGYAVVGAVIVDGGGVREVCYVEGCVVIVGGDGTGGVYCVVGVGCSKSSLVPRCAYLGFGVGYLQHSCKACGVVGVGVLGEACLARTFVSWQE